MKISTDIIISEGKLSVPINFKENVWMLNKNTKNKKKALPILSSIMPFSISYT